MLLELTDGLAGVAANMDAGGFSREPNQLSEAEPRRKEDGDAPH